MTHAAEIFAPGEFLKEELDARNWSQAEFAEIIGRPARLVNEIIAGKKSITPETAIQLGDALDTGPELWLNLESQFQLSKVRPVDNAVQRKAKLYSYCPVREMIKRHWIEPSKNVDVMENQIFSYFGVRSTDEPPRFDHAARKTSYAGVSIEQYAWLFRARQIARQQVLIKYKMTLLRDALLRLRTLLSAPEEVRHVPRVLAECGVSFVVVEALPGSKIDGACFWLANDRPVVALSLRLDRIDNFWFVLRHEIEHVLQGHGKNSALWIDEDIAEKTDSDTVGGEKLANEAAADFCVDQHALADYMARVSPYCFSERRVRGFAARIGVHPGLVVGQLQRRLDQFQYLRRYLVKVRHLVTESASSDGWGSPYLIS